MKSTALCILLLLFYRASANHGSSTIIFTTNGRSSYAFDIYTLPTSYPPSISNELQLTDGDSVNFNGYFPSSLPPSVVSRIPDHILSINTSPFHLVYVTERNGSHHVFLDSVYYGGYDNRGSRSVLEETGAGESTRDGVVNRVQIPLVGVESRRVSIKDKPTLVGDSLIYVSTHEDPGVGRASWAAVYSTQLDSGLTRRLTPYSVADFSPAVSPSGVWTAVASYGETGWTGDIEELATDIYVFLTRDGSNRVKVVEHGGWPSWVDDSTLYFHRRCDDGWWSVFVAVLRENNGELGVESVSIQRVTPPGLHAFTPAASPADKRLLAVATRRSGSDYRQIELFNVNSGQFTEITRPVSPQTHHFNPFFSPDASRVGYHKCRGPDNGNTFLLETIKNPAPESEFSLFRFDGSFPSFSPDGSRIAYVDFPGVYVVNNDGSGLKKLSEDTAFSTAWDPKRKGVVYTSVGPDFASESTAVDIVAINVDDESPSYKKLTIGGKNNAFPSPSPDGKWVVFRSGRSGHKNLYIMDAVEGEAGGLFRLTEGPWSDTMGNWSPDGEWIAFASDRESPGSGSFELFLIHPNGTGLRKLAQSGTGGRTNHPWFSPDGKYVVFTTDYAGVSAEPISNPHHYQPYGDIFIIRSDGSELRRLTHNSYEDGTPTWGPIYIEPKNIEWANGGDACSFEDCHWLNISPSNNATITQCAH